MVLMISVLMLFLIFAGCDASIFYNESAVVNGLRIEISREANKCFAGCYTCNDYEENMEITIPDSYDGIPLTQLGGYVGSGAPSPFWIDTEGKYTNIPYDADVSYWYDGEKALCESDDALSEFNGDYRIENVIFKLNLGKNITRIELVSMGDYLAWINEDESITFYHPVVYIVCSEENKHFYSRDGRLYSRETDELITAFSYADSMI